MSFIFIAQMRLTLKRIVQDTTATVTHSTSVSHNIYFSCALYNALQDKFGTLKTSTGIWPQCVC